MEPSEFSSLVKEGLAAFESLGNEEWSMQPSEMESRRLRRSLFIAENVRAGEMVSFQNVRSIRPGHGLNAKYQESIQGMVFNRDFVVGTPLSLDMLDEK
jgi:sialic acid synthase SpsE